MVHSTSKIIGIKINHYEDLILEKELECSHDKDIVES